MLLSHRDVTYNRREIWGKLSYGSRAFIIYVARFVQAFIVTARAGLRAFS